AARAGLCTQTFDTWVHALGWKLRVPNAGGGGQKRRGVLPPWVQQALREAAAAAEPPPAAAAPPTDPPTLPSPPAEPASSADAPEEVAPDAAAGGVDRRCVDRMTAAARLSLAERVQRTVERELDAVERVLACLRPANESEVERTARTLASLARTLRDIVAFDDPPAVEPDDDDDAGPRDMDEFRRDLARQIDEIIAARNRTADRGAEE
ncbi:MAG: hypothetical protein AB7T08_08070, partial [Hyphomonadaceae bacterium]